ncbi:hypothetical protein, partial [Candidatus Frankia nodulisporulans]|uniref:hypothetical protein n=1 Tax=Candidatus Frankia nodulisporulans TaxID=2060052 RepID=UPI001C2E44DE
YGPINHATPTPQDRQAIKASQPAEEQKTNDLRDLTSYLQMREFFLIYVIFWCVPVRLRPKERCALSVRP